MQPLKAYGNNTKLHSTTLGEIELKYISHGDTKFIQRLIDQKLTPKNFTKKVLHHQLVKPQITYEKYLDIPEEEIVKMGKAFINKESEVLGFYSDTGNFYEDFDQAWSKYQKKLNDYYRSIAQQTINDFKDINKSYHSVIQSSLNDSSIVSEAMKNLKNLNNNLYHSSKYINDAVASAIKGYEATAKILNETLRPQIDHWQNWVKNNKSIFTDINQQWSEFEKKYKIAEEKAAEVLHRYKWFISPNMPADFIFEVVQIARKKGRQDQAINRLFIDYFAKNNWANLEYHIQEWCKNPLFTKRKKIIFSCLKLLKNSDKDVNIPAAIIPTLIAQIDGYLTDYLAAKNISYSSEYDDFIDKNTGKVKRIGRKTQFTKLHPRSSASDLYSLADTIFLNILFQGSQKGKPLKTPFNFNRHKIMHGESVSFGRNDYMIRCFLILDFLTSLK